MNTAEVITIFCPGCNERFHVAAESPSCPRCGGGVRTTNIVNLADTLLIRAGGDDLGSPKVEMEKQDDVVGSRIHCYYCESLIGSGGMGRVYLAMHMDLHRRCALKILAPRQAEADAEYVARFVQEGRAAAALVHPNIVTTHAVGETDGLHFIEMEFVVGRSLQQLISDEERLTPVRATQLMIQTADGLATAHRNDIIHRDLKPDNILLSQCGTAKISDFGLAKRVASNCNGIEDTICGTPHFMAPELFQGNRATQASDVYALGVCYYLLLTGRLPFVGSPLNDLAGSVTNDRIPSIRKQVPDVPLEMAECLNILLSKTPANRPRDAMEACQLLQAIIGSVRDIESLLKDAFDFEKNVTWTRDGESYRLLVQLHDGRKQTVFVEPAGERIAERLLSIYSVCCDAEPSYYEEALKLNSEIPHGGIAVSEIDGRAKFVVIDNYPRGTVEPEEMRRSVIEVAQRADDIEHFLTGMDIN